MTAGTGRPAAAVPPLAYLVSVYPLLSHTFIEREVRALRALGVDLETWSVRPVAEADQLSERDREAARTTRFVLGRSPLRIAAAHLGVALLAPRAYAETMAAAWRQARPGLRARVWQLFYFVEAVLLHADLRRSARRHIHVHFTNNASDVARLAVGLGRARGEPEWSWSLTVHGPTEFADVPGTDLAAKVRDARFVVCISDFARSQLMALVEEDHWAKLLVVHCGIEPDSYPLLEPDRAGRTGPLRWLAVGRLVEVKGQSVLLEALAAHRAGGGQAELALVGSGPREARLRRYAEELGVSSHVRFVGAVGQDDILDWYRWADVFCLSSFAEGVPVVLMEAMATGLPVVTTRIAGIPELVEDGVSGFVVPPGRPDLLAAAIARCADPEARVRLGRAGREAVTSGYETAATARQLAAAYAARLAVPVGSLGSLGSLGG